MIDHAQGFHPMHGTSMPAMRAKHAANTTPDIPSTELTEHPTHLESIVIDGSTPGSSQDSPGSVTPNGDVEANLVGGLAPAVEDKLESLDSPKPSGTAKAGTVEGSAPAVAPDAFKPLTAHLSKGTAEAAPHGTAQH